MFAILALLPISALADPSEFCRDRVVKDYEGPLRQMISSQPPPEQEDLPFGPRGLSIYRMGFGRVALQGESFGYRFSARHGTTRTGRLKHALVLHWDVETTLWAVNRHGHPLRAVARKNQRLGVVRYLQRLESVFAAKPGLYRFDLSFRKPNGRLLGSYSEYFRVVPRRVALRVAVSTGEVHPGETILGRVENRGTVNALLPNGSGLAVEREVDGAWIKVPSGPPGAIVESTGEFLDAGDATACSSFEISQSAAAGLYRFSAAAEPFGAHERQRLLTRNFTVIP